jgi:hypothetical protein
MGSPATERTVNRDGYRRTVKVALQMDGNVTTRNCYHACYSRVTHERDNSLEIQSSFHSVLPIRSIKDVPGMSREKCWTILTLMATELLPNHFHNASCSAHIYGIPSRVRLGHADVSLIPMFNTGKPLQFR